MPVVFTFDPRKADDMYVDSSYLGATIDVFEEARRAILHHHRGQEHQATSAQANKYSTFAYNTVTSSYLGLQGNVE